MKATKVELSDLKPGDVVYVKTDTGGGYGIVTLNPGLDRVEMRWADSACNGGYGASQFSEDTELIRSIYRLDVPSDPCPVEYRPFKSVEEVRPYFGQELYTRFGGRPGIIDGASEHRAAGVRLLVENGKGAVTDSAQWALDNWRFSNGDRVGVKL